MRTKNYDNLLKYMASEPSEEETLMERKKGVLLKYEDLSYYYELGDEELGKIVKNLLGYFWDGEKMDDSELSQMGRNYLERCATSESLNGAHYRQVCEQARKNRKNAKNVRNNTPTDEEMEQLENDCPFK